MPNGLPIDKRSGENTGSPPGLSGVGLQLQGTGMTTLGSTDNGMGWFCAVKNAPFLDAA